MTRRPNILWLCTDQQRFDTLGSTGNTFVHTPTLDALSKAGVTLERAFVQSPVCTPSRASFLTGRYPRTTRCRQNGQAIPPDERLITSRLAEAGYTCGLSGKLHLAPANPSLGPGPEARIDDGYSEFNWSHHPDPDWPTNSYIRWLSDTHKTPYTRRDHPSSRFIHLGMPSEAHQTTWCAQMAADFITNQAKNRSPWLFSVNFFDPHHPFDPPETHLERHLRHLDAIPLPDFDPAELDHKPHYQRLDHQGAYHTPGLYPWAEMTPSDHRLIRAAYFAMIDLVDEAVATILKALEDTGQARDTLIIFMSDHGELLGDRGIYLKGPHFYEPAVRVPLIFSWPGHLTPQRSEALVELVDLAPTLMEAVGLPPHPAMQGRSLWPLLRGESPEHRDEVYCEYYNAMPWHQTPQAHATMVRTHRHKLTRYHSSDEGELYDLTQDPLERHNLWADASHRGLKEAMLARLCDKMAWTVDPWPPRQADW